MRQPRIGDRVQVAYGSGLYSRAVGTVVAPVPWQGILGMYEAPNPQRESCILLDEGQQRPNLGRHIYMFNNRLEVIA